MTSRIPDELLARLSEFLAAQMGLHYPPERWKDLQRGIATAAPELGYADAELCTRWLLSTPLTKSQIEILASHLTVGETYFFRDRRSFEHLERDVLPALIRLRAQNERQIRVWSAGCCSGEEPYSIAMLLYKLIPDRESWKITILGTDVNPRFLEKATRAVYTDWSFRGNPPSMRDRFFTPVAKGQYELRAEIRQMVTFGYLNLSEDTYPSLSNGTTALDVILCRNVLIYFSTEGCKRVINGFYRCLVNGGWLLVSASETSHVHDSAFTAVNFPGAILYRKEPTSNVLPIVPPVESLTWQEAVPLRLGSPLGSGVSQRNPPNTPVSPPLALKSVPRLKEDSYPEALELYRQGRTADAAAKLGAIASRCSSPTAAEAPTYALLARIYANEGKLSDALVWCDRAIAVCKTEPPYRYLRATILQEQGSVDDAVTSLKGAIYLDADFVLAHFALGNLARQQGKLQEGDRHLQNAHVLLGQYSHEDQLPEGEGLTAGRLSEVIASMTSRREAP